MSDPTRLGALELAAAIRTGELSARDAVAAHLSRIESLDPEIRAFVRMNPRALDEADAVDRSGPAGPLAGVPFAAKDNLTTEGLETSCGSAALAGWVPTTDATAVARMRKSGAVLLGKTNLDEFGMGSSTEHSIHGATRNPWDGRRVAGGSSGGSAAAVAARLAPIALGSDTGGSIRQPASFCGVYGLKPTRGTVSRFGLCAYASSLDHVGPLARTACDLAAALDAISGRDERDATSVGIRHRLDRPDLEHGVRGMRIGVPVECLEADGLDPGIVRRVEEAGRLLERCGAKVEPVSLGSTRHAVAAYYLVATAEASSNLARYDGVRFGSRSSATSLETMYRRTRARGFGTEVRRRIALGTFALSRGYQARFYQRATRVRDVVRDELRRVFESGVRLLLTPVSPTTAFARGEKTADPVAMYLSDVFTVTANLAGVPALAVPLGAAGDGLPIGAQLTAAHFDEGALICAANLLATEFPVGDPRP